MQQKSALVYLAIGQILTWATLFYIFPAMLVTWEREMHWSKANITAAITLALFISAISSPTIGKLIDKGIGPQLMALSTLAGGLSLFCLGYVTTLLQFYLLWALIGISLAGCLYEPCFALITRARGKHARQGIILVTLIAGFASSISFPTAHTLVDMIGWRNTVQAFALVCIFLATPLMWIGARQIENNRLIQSGEKDQARATDKTWMKSSAFWFLALGFALLAIVHGVTLHHLIPILLDRGISAEVAVTAAAFIGPMQIAGRLAMMSAQNHISNHGIAICCFTFMSLAILLLIIAGASPSLMVGFVILFGGAYGLVSIIRPLITRDILGEVDFGAKSGALAVPFLIGSASAPFLGSLLWGVGGYSLVLPFLVTIGLCGLLLYILANKSARQD